MIKKAVKQDQNLQRITFPPAGLNLLLSLPVSQAVLQKSRSRPEAQEAVNSIPLRGIKGGASLTICLSSEILFSGDLWFLQPDFS